MMAPVMLLFSRHQAEEGFFIVTQVRRESFVDLANYEKETLQRKFVCLLRIKPNQVKSCSVLTQ